jgi:hypothetical protein
MKNRRLGMDINMTYYLPAEFGAINEDGDVWSDKLWT